MIERFEAFSFAVKEINMEIQLSQKERMLLEDDKVNEEICIAKYQNYANQAQDPELKQLFNSLATQEQQHFDTISQLLQGQQPNMNQAQQSQAPQSTQAQQSSYQGAMCNVGDKILCTDLLSTEKQVSASYDIGVFEAANPIVRQTLQHIQQEEQHHGEQLFNYMNSHGMYNVQ